MGIHDPSRFGELLRQRRLSTGWSQEALAEAAGISARTITELERGAVRAPRTSTLEMLADALDLQSDERQQWHRLRRRLSVRQQGAGGEDSIDAGFSAPPGLLVGREEEVQRLSALLHDPDVRLITVTGPGGVGKTRLALEVARQVSPQMPAGVLFVELATVRDHRLVLPTLAHSLGLSGLNERDIYQRILGYLTQRDMLLVIDNFEHVLPAATDVARLITGNSRCRILVTSRARLRIQAEQEFRLDPLSLPDQNHQYPTDSLHQFAAVQLFVERGRRVCPDFAITAENSSYVGSICMHLDGLPLAIELAAARIKLLTPQAMLPRLVDRLAFLTDGFQDGPDRHRTMRAAIGWSYELLDESDQRLFRSLSTFVDGWSLEAAEESNPGVDNVLEGLARLLDNSLIFQTGKPDGNVRFGMLETIREYGLERLEEAGELEGKRAQHGEYFLRLAEDIESHLRGPEQEYWLDQVAMDLGNFHAALAWTEEPGTPSEFGLRLTAALSWFWFTRGYASQGLRWLTSALCTDPEQSVPRMKALASAGWLAHFQPDAKAARTYLNASLEIARALDDDWYTAWTMYLLGRVAYFEHDSATARTLGNQSLEIAAAIGDDWLTASPHHLLALAAYIDEDFDSAKASFETSLIFRRWVNDQPGIAAAYSILGMISYWEGDYQRALNLLRESMTISHQLGALWFFANVLGNLATVATRLGEPRRAARLLGFVTEAYRISGAGPIPISQTVLRQGERELRRALSSGEIKAGRDNGSRMTQDEVLEEALLIGHGFSTPLGKWEIAR